MAANNTLPQKMPASASFSDSEILSFLDANGIIDLRGVQNAMKKERREKILSQHPYAITLGKDKRWRTYVADSSMKNGRRMIAKSTREKLEDSICEHAESMHVEADCQLTMAELYPAWLEHKALRVEPTTISRDKKNWKKYYQDSDIVSIPIRNLRKVDIEDWVHRNMGKNKMNKHQFSHLTTIVKQMLDYAVDIGIIDQNPYDLVRVDRKRMLAQEHKKPDYTQVYLDQELIDIYEHAWKDYEKDSRRKHKLVPLALMFMFQTGLRISEVSVIRYEDISGNILTVRRMLQYETNAVLDSTKGTYGDRTVFLTPDALSLIEKAKERQISDGVPSDGYIFSMVDNPKNTYKAISRAFENYCKDLGIINKSSHKARKTFISRLIKDGVNINTVRSFAGHKDERTTYNNYCFDTSTEDEKYSQVVNALAV